MAVKNTIRRGKDGRIGRPEFTSSHMHNKITTLYREIIDEKD